MSTCARPACGRLVTRVVSRGLRAGELTPYCSETCWKEARREKTLARKHRLIRTRREAGLCVYCGKVPATKFWGCLACRTRENARQRARARRRKAA